MALDAPQWAGGTINRWQQAAQSRPQAQQQERAAAPPVMGPPSVQPGPVRGATTYTPQPGAQTTYAQTQTRQNMERQARDAQNQMAAGAAVRQATLNHNPLLAGLGLDRHQMTTNAGYRNQGFNLSEQELRGQYGSNVAQLGLANRGIGLSRDELANQRGFLDLDRRGNQVDRGYIGSMQQIADRVLQSNIGGFERDLATDQRNTTSDFTARGAFFAPFHAAELRDRQDRFDQQSRETRLGRERDEAGWQRDLSHLGLSDERIDLKGKDLSIAEQRLDLEASRLGLQRADYDRALSEGLARLGLDRQMSASDLAFMMAGSDQAQADLARQIADQALMYYSNSSVRDSIMGNIFRNQGRG